MSEDENMAGGWPPTEKVVEVGGLDVLVSIAPNGEVSAEPVPPQPGSTFTVSYKEREYTVRVTERCLYILGGDALINSIPYDDGKIPRMVGYKMVPGWFVNQLRLHGITYPDDYEWEHEE